LSTGTMDLPIEYVRGLSLVPSPPTRIIAFISGI